MGEYGQIKKIRKIRKIRKNRRVKKGKGFDFLKTLSSFINFASKVKAGDHVMALDIGRSAVKVMFMESKYESKKFTLLNYALVPLPEGALIEGDVNQAEKVITAIQEALNLSNITTKNCCFGVSGADTVVKKLSLSDGTNDEIEDQIIWESSQYLPFDIDEAKLGFHILKKNEGGGVDVLIGVAKASHIATYKDLIEESGLQLKIVDMGTIAIVNVFEQFKRGTHSRF